ncbi:MAG TPA: cyclophane-forming radical SAM/SPASM peptide maturase YhhB [Phenylobacterium sp.]|nr:cyclophane-forming radical SAM/SPASM peptide maturase YhhB [Phenylobacterium sp.]
MHVDTVLLKVASRCNLDCSYCYVYHMGDESWRALPKRMAADTQALVAEELGALMRAQGRPFSIVLHGGEPLLLGLPRLESLFAALRAQLGAACGISIQTNGVLITDAVLDLCLRFDVTLSVSLDGPPAVHDRFRVDLRQRSTHAKVMAGLDRLKTHPAAGRLFSGVLCVVDPTSDPEGVYDYFKAIEVPSVDFLYRDGNHTTLPFGKASADTAEYGAWMCRILDRYVADPAPFRSRLIDDMMRLLLGGAGVKEGVGLTDYGILVIDTDGAVKKNDTLKSSPLGDTFDATWALGRQALADIAASPEFKAYHLAQRPSSPTCQACPHVRVCGGGMVTHRFKDGAGYDNPTVFCADQMLLIARMEALLAPYLKDRAA